MITHIKGTEVDRDKLQMKWLWSAGYNSDTCMMLLTKSWVYGRSNI